MKLRARRIFLRRPIPEVFPGGPSDFDACIESFPMQPCGAVMYPAGLMTILLYQRYAVIELTYPDDLTRDQGDGAMLIHQHPTGPIQ